MDVSGRDTTNYTSPGRANSPLPPQPTFRYSDKTKPPDSCFLYKRTVTRASPRDSVAFRPQTTKETKETERGCTPPDKRMRAPLLRGARHLCVSCARHFPLFPSTYKIGRSKSGPIAYGSNVRLYRRKAQLSSSERKIRTSRILFFLTKTGANRARNKTSNGTTVRPVKRFFFMRVQK